MKDRDYGSVDRRGSVDWRGVLSKLVNGESLPEETSHQVMASILEGGADDAKLAALLMGVECKGKTADELVGFARAMRAASTPVNLPPGTIDIVGTGGSAHRHQHALNVSTMACFVAAAAGARVCKHGNRKATSTSGSFDFLEALGIEIDLGAHAVHRCVEEVGIGFVYARNAHPAMRHAVSARASIGIPTFFNVLGPLAHPGEVRYQLIGAPTSEIAELVAASIQRLGCEKVWVVVGCDESGAEGFLDELSTIGPSKLLEVTSDSIAEIAVQPQDLGLSSASQAELAGGDADQNAKIFQAILDGDEPKKAEAVTLNAAAALTILGIAPDIDSGYRLASSAIESGAVSEKVESLRELTTLLAETHTQN